MSADLFKRARCVPAEYVTASERIVLLLLAFDAGPGDGISEPGLADLVRWSAKSASTVTRALRSLQLATPKRPPLLRQVLAGHHGQRAAYLVLPTEPT